MFRAVCLLAILGLALGARLNVDQEWEKFKNTHNKVYSNLKEEVYRQEVFAKNLEKINRHNELAENGLKTYTLGVNKFTDLTYEEFKSTYLGYKPKLHKPAPLLHNSNYTVNLPSSVDWRTKGIVTPIKDQGQCGSCWAFSTVASVEGAQAQKTSKLVSLSEQNLMDCSASYGNQGCEGGLMDNGFQYILDNKGIDTEACYPYEGEDEDECEYKKSCRGASITSYVDIASGDEDALRSASATRVVSVAIDAEDDLQMYDSGVLRSDECSPDALNHGVTVVGYGEEGSTPYWIVKNSWGESWGEQGYFRLYRGENECGIAQQASYPLV